MDENKKETKTIECHFCWMEHDNGTACPNMNSDCGIW